MLPVVRSGRLDQVQGWIEQMDLTAANCRELVLLIIMGVQMLPAFWFGCFWGGSWINYLVNMLILAALALLVFLVRNVFLKGKEKV